LTRDHRVTNGTIAYMKWFYRQAATVFTRSAAYRFKLSDLNVSEKNIAAIMPGVDTDRFNPRHRDERVWSRLGVREPLRLLYAGRVSVEKNLPMLVEFFRMLCARRSDVGLIVAGDGPYRDVMRRELAEFPAYFPGNQDDCALATLYASSDLLVFPSRTDTLGQVVIEAQASGLPAIVCGDGGPKEIVDDGRTGVVLPSEDPARWARVSEELLDDRARRDCMSQAAVARAQRATLARTFDGFWAAHLGACEKASVEPIVNVDTQLAAAAAAAVAHSTAT
jgi:glycosyltransferase involved in cell wall biosynthesis